MYFPHSSNQYTKWKLYFWHNDVSDDDMPMLVVALLALNHYTKWKIYFWHTDVSNDDMAMRIVALLERQPV